MKDFGDETDCYEQSASSVVIDAFTENLIEALC